MDAQEFDNYGIGSDVFSNCSRGEEINEILRFFVEECDSTQGFQFIIDDSGGFSAIGADMLENIADEYTNAPLLLYSVQSSHSVHKSRNQKQSVVRDLHDAVSFSKLSPFCKLIVPVGLPSLSTSKAARFLSIKDEKPYHCSAVYAASFHSLSLPFWVEQARSIVNSHDISGSVDVNGIVQMLAGQNYVAILDVAMPAPPLKGKQIEQTLLGNLQPLTPEITEDLDGAQSVESITVHGTFGSGGCRTLVAEVEAAYRRGTSRPMFFHLSAAQCPLPIPLPFPSIFRNLVSQHGELLSSPTIDNTPLGGSLNVHSIPIDCVLAVLSCRIWRID